MEASSSKKILLKNSFVTVVTTSASRIFGLLREQTVAYFLGTGMGADVFILAFHLPNLFRRLLGEGIMSAAFIPLYSELLRKGSVKEASSFASRFFCALGIVIAILIVLFMIFTEEIILHVFAPGFQALPEKLHLTVMSARLMIFYILFIGLASVFQGILNSHLVFFPSAFTPILLSCSVIGCAFFAGGWFSTPVYALGFGILLGGFFQLAFQYPFIKKLGIHFFLTLKIWDKDIKHAIRLWLPALFGAGIYQINIIVSDRIASGLQTGSIASLGYSNRLMELILGIFAVSVSTVVLPILSRLCADGNYNEMKKMTAYGYRIIAFVCIPASLALFVMRENILHLLFTFRSGAFNQNSLLITASVLQYHALGLLWIALARISIPVYYAFQNTRTPVWIGLASVIFNCVLCYTLVPFMQQKGIALANSLAALFQFCLLLTFLPRIIFPQFREILVSVAKISIASIVMAVACSWLCKTLHTYLMYNKLIEVVLMLFVILFGATIFIAFSFLLRVSECKELLLIIKKKKML